MKPFQVNDRIIYNNRLGTITAIIDDNITFPLAIDFDDGDEDFFTLDGYEWENDRNYTTPIAYAPGFIETIEFNDKLKKVLE